MAARQWLTGIKADAKPGQLSGVQQQRVAIARALANDPLILATHSSEIVARAGYLVRVRDGRIETAGY